MSASRPPGKADIEKAALNKGVSQVVADAAFLSAGGLPTASRFSARLVLRRLFHLQFLPPHVQQIYCSNNAWGPTQRESTAHRPPRRWENASTANLATDGSRANPIDAVDPDQRPARGARLSKDVQGGQL